MYLKWDSGLLEVIRDEYLEKNLAYLTWGSGESGLLEVIRDEYLEKKLAYLKWGSGDSELLEVINQSEGGASPHGIFDPWARWPRRVAGVVISVVVCVSVVSVGSVVVPGWVARGWPKMCLMHSDIVERTP